MSQTPRSHAYGQLAAPDIRARLSRQSVLCLAIGSVEQHGPHLPLGTISLKAPVLSGVLDTLVGEVCAIAPSSGATIGESIITSAVQAIDDVLVQLTRSRHHVLSEPRRTDVPHH